MTVKLTKISIHNFRCIETEQTVDISPDVTVLVGMNESGKTSMLEAMAKTNCYNDDSFKFDLQNDYPRRNLNRVKRSGDTPIAITLHYDCDSKILEAIEDDIGTTAGIKSFKVQVLYNNEKLFSFDSESVDYNLYLNHVLGKSIGSDLIKSITSCIKKSELDSLVSDSVQEDEIQKLKDKTRDKENFNNIIDSYLFSTHIIPNLPKFMYFDEYYSLPSEVSLNHFDQSKESYKTAKALLDLAAVNLNDLKSDEYETVRTELEATQADISRELLRHWSTNSNLKFVFDIDKIEDRFHHNIVDLILKIRVENTRYGVTLPLERRSRGFNWFFSFLVWFKKIEMDENNSCIILLDEPGLNLHAKAQNDLLSFINNELGQKFQVIYTTHSPFMIDSSKLFNVRTIVESDDGTLISDCIAVRDRDTLFPLQAALGYDIAQNLFISSYNLVVEGVADLMYIETMSDYLKQNGRCGLDSRITIVPVGGADKVTSFISLLSGNKLDVVCLLDTIKTNKLEEKLYNTIKKLKIDERYVLFYNEFIGSDYADVEDMFEKQDYLKIYNSSLHKNLILDGDGPILEQIKKAEGSDFNHFTPARHLAKNIEECCLSEKTIANFESMFKKINSLFKFN